MSEQAIIDISLDEYSMIMLQTKCQCFAYADIFHSLASNFSLCFKILKFDAISFCKSKCGIVNSVHVYEERRVIFDLNDIGK